MNFVKVIALFLAFALQGCALPIEMTRSPDFTEDSDFDDSIWFGTLTYIFDNDSTTNVEASNGRVEFSDQENMNALNDTDGETTPLLLITDSKGLLIYGGTSELNSLDLDVSKAPDCEDECMPPKDVLFTNENLPEFSNGTGYTSDELLKTNLTFHHAHSTTDIENIEIRVTTDEMVEEGSTIIMVVSTMEDSTLSNDSTSWITEKHPANDTTVQFTETSSMTDFIDEETSTDVNVTYSDSTSFNTTEMTTILLENTEQTTTEESITTDAGSTNGIDPVSNSTGSIESKCPSPGICFWFQFQHQCSRDSECAEGQSCCKIRCSKKCITV